METLQQPTNADIESQAADPKETSIEPEVELLVPEVPIGLVEVVFRHRTINHFVVGRFVFKDHILRMIGTPDEVAKEEAAFLDLYRGLMGPDRNNIKRIVNTQPQLFDSPAVRGALGTHQISDKAAPSGGIPAPQVPKQPAGFNFKRN